MHPAEVGLLIIDNIMIIMLSINYHTPEIDLPDILFTHT